MMRKLLIALMMVLPLSVFSIEIINLPEKFKEEKTKITENVESIIANRNITNDVKSLFHLHFNDCYLYFVSICGNVIYLGNSENEYNNQVEQVEKLDEIENEKNYYSDGY